MFQSKFHILSLFVVLLLLHVIAGIYFNGYAPWWIGLIILIYIGLLFLGSYYIQWNFYLKSQLRLPLIRLSWEKNKIALEQQGKKVALTFDDGPADYTESILDILKKAQVKASFFIIGDQVTGREGLLKRMQEEGHVIGNHSMHHGRNFDWKSSRSMIKEINAANEKIESVTGQAVKLFRPPFGVTNPNVRKAVQATGMKSIGWTIRSFDTVTASKEKLLQRIMRKLKPGAIILLHDRCAITKEILPDLIQGVQERGYTFDTV